MRRTVIRRVITRPDMTRTVIRRLITQPDMTRTDIRSRISQTGTPTRGRIPLIVMTRTGTARVIDTTESVSGGDNIYSLPAQEVLYEKESVTDCIDHRDRVDRASRRFRPGTWSGDRARRKV